MEMPDFTPAIRPPPRARVAVVAAGAMSPLGRGLVETGAALREGRDCITAVERFSVEQCRCTTAGQIRDEELTAAEVPVRKAGRLHRVARMMIVALAEALEQSPGFAPELTVVGTTSGGMTFGEEYY